MKHIIKMPDGTYFHYIAKNGVPVTTDKKQAKTFLSARHANAMMGTLAIRMKLGRSQFKTEKVNPQLEAAYPLIPRL